jgi:uncharacterized protein (TIGR02145 family)
MKRITFTAIFVLITGIAMAQLPQGINYQAIARDNQGQVLADQEVSFHISIIQGETSGPAVYVENHNIATNEFGLVNLVIGQGEDVSGSLSAINWATGPYFLQIEFDADGGTDYLLIGANQLLHVPYAYHASSLTLTSPNGTRYGVGVDNDGNLFTFMVEEPPCPETVIDADGNTYYTLWLAERCWMAENLKTTKYRDGSPIDYPGTNNSAWENNTTGAYAWYNNDISNKDLYGALYNWYAVDNAKDLCPVGWRVPSDEDWNALQDFIPGLDHLKGNKLKSCRQVNSPLGGDCNTNLHPRWNEHGTHYGTDEYGFSGLPGGRRVSTGNYQEIGSFGWWRTSTEISGNNHGKWLGSGSGSIGNQPLIPKNQGLSVRCIKNQ